MDENVKIKGRIHLVFQVPESTSQDACKAQTAISWLDGFGCMDYFVLEKIIFEKKKKTRPAGTIRY